MIVIYHANCQDGFCAAWLFQLNYPDATFVPDTYGKTPAMFPEDVKDEDVYIVDFSYPKDHLESLKQSAKSLLVLDHHKTAESELKDLDYAHFDMSKCGARMAYEYLLETNNLEFSPIVETLVNYVQDRDLWEWKLKCSKEINAWLSSQPHDFSKWNRWLNNHHNDFFEKATIRGEAIIQYQEQIIQSHVDKAIIGDISGYRVPIVNATVLISEIAGRLAEGYPFGVCYFDCGSNGIVYSLRSRDSGIDVSGVAKVYGGGGHAKAAGFIVAGGFG